MHKTVLGGGCDIWVTLLFEGDDTEHIVHSDCAGDVRIEHYGMEAQEHTWPNQVSGTDTYQLIWDFLSEFTN